MTSKRNQSSILLILTLLVLMIAPIINTATAEDTDTFTVYLPSISKNKLTENIFGTEFANITSANGLDQMKDLNIAFVRYNALKWSSVSPNNATDRNWADVSWTDTQIKTITGLGMTPIVIVSSTPVWARTLPDYGCSAIKSNNLQDFADFMHDAVVRYSAPAFNVKYWEIWNEPDVDPTGFVQNDIYGCWGDSSDPYYGGGYYGEMLKVVYPAIKSADPDAQVLVGGLLLDCDPQQDSTCISSKFFEGILRNGGGPYFDGVSFHGYDYYPAMSNMIGAYLNVNWKTAWNTTGPVITAKAGYLRGLMDNPAYNASGKYLINTEGAMVCDACTNNANYETTKAYYIPQLYAVAIADNLKGNLWYTVMGWRNSGLLWPNLQPRPAYNAFAVARWKLDGAQYVPPKLEYNLDGDPSIDVVAYQFLRGNTTVWVIWSLDGGSYNFNLPSSPTAVYDVFGTQLNSSSTINVTIKPLYIEWKP